MTSSSPTSLHSRSSEDLRHLARACLQRCGVAIETFARSTVTARTPVTGDELFDIPAADAAAVGAAVQAAHEAFLRWRTVPAPERGRLVKRFGELVERHRHDLAELIMIEVGKIRSEALGEVQEMIDVCDFAVGLSRRLEGRTMPSERPGHRLMETWHPLGVVAVISAFNFPAAVWAWNAAIALVCGDTVVWKPSPMTSLTALACSALLERAAAECDMPAEINRLVICDVPAAGILLDSPLVPLVSATGSERMGAEIAPRIARRFGRSILELGGNNAAVVAPSADLDLAVRGIAFAAAGTAGQRCTTMRRVIAHESVVDELVERLDAAYAKLVVGDPFDQATLVGPLIDGTAFGAMRRAVDRADRDGGTVVTGGTRVDREGAPQAYYARPAIVRMPGQSDIVRQETFAPLLYVMTYDSFEEAIGLHNAVPQGLSSSIFTRDQREAESFLAADGSDCGIVNVNIGTSGAEIGGAFGGEKSTGGGRESGSDAWRGYMRRATNTINYSSALPLAQGVEFA
ncbi:L-piperidine-6-carboxylate dehydrogenase [Nonomuraea antimicrobica]|uniref:L-piperidine-6-carboxylate dehydrogenase n=1 Tax=Nonomuraea antimicrobica TaxID=561173 RepID=UPI003CD0AB40